jgi:hypothetical protein
MLQQPFRTFDNSRRAAASAHSSAVGYAGYAMRVERAIGVAIWLGFVALLLLQSH